MRIERDTTISEFVICQINVPSIKDSKYKVKKTCSCLNAL